MANLEFFFDFASPYTYFAAEELLRAPRYREVEITWTPILLGGLFKVAGNRAPAEVPAKGAYLFKDLVRLSRYHKLDFRFPDAFPINSLMPMRAATALLKRNDGKALDYVRAMFRAYWVDSKNISDPEVWAAITNEAGFDAAELTAQTQEADVKEALKQNTSRVAELGAFGAPSFCVDGELYWGFDRMYLVDDALGLTPTKA